MVLGDAFSNLGRLARSLALGQGGHGRGLATEGLQNLLGQSVAAKKGRSAASEFGAPRVKSSAWRSRTRIGVRLAFTGNYSSWEPRSRSARFPASCPRTGNPLPRRGGLS